MLAGDGGSSIGSALGSIAAKAGKSNKSKGGTIGRTAAKAAKSSSSSRRRSSSSSGSSYSSGGSSSRRSSGSSGSRRSSGGGGGGGGSSHSTPAPAPNPTPSINSYLGGDSAYQNVVRGGKRSLADFLSEMGRRRGEAGTQYNQTRASMERDRTQQLEDLKNEFASRGLIQSGLYGEEQGRFQQQFTQQQQAMAQQQAALLADLMSQEKNYRRDQDLSLEAAKQEALQRRAAKYGVGG